MFTTYRFFKPLLLIFLFTLAPLQSMETNSNYNHVEVVTYEPNDETSMQLHTAIHGRNLNEVIRILKTYPAIINRVDAKLLDIPYLFFADNKNAETHTYALHITHLLLSFGMHMDSISNNQSWSRDPICLIKILLDESERTQISYPEIIHIILRHINRRLYIAIEEGNVNEVRRLVQKYIIHINTELFCYARLNYGTPFVSVDAITKPDSTCGFPLHHAVKYNQARVVRLLVDELGANVNIQDSHNATAIHYETDLEIVQFLVSKGADLTIRDNNGQTPINRMNDYLAQEMLGERSYTANNINNIHNNHNSNLADDPILVSKGCYLDFHDSNDQAPIDRIENHLTLEVPNEIEHDPERVENFGHNNLNSNPTDNPTVITNGALPWKFIGGSVAAIVIVVAAKKLYNWWHTKAKTQEEDNESEAQDTQQPVADVHA